jgi:uncharacterized protein (TIGR03083 family)
VTISDDVAREYLELADLLEEAPASLWDAPSLCVGWRTREVVAHMTMPARLSESEFFTELQAAGGDFTKLSNTLAVRDGALAPTALLADLRSSTLHRWEPPGGTPEDALVHAVIHGLDITEATGLDRRVPTETVTRVLALVGTGDVFGVDLDGVELRATDLDWSQGSGSLVTGPVQVLALVACGRRVPAGKLNGDASARFAQL